MIHDTHEVMVDEIGYDDDGMNTNCYYFGLLVDSRYLMFLMFGSPDARDWAEVMMKDYHLGPEVRNHYIQGYINDA